MKAESLIVELMAAIDQHGDLEIETEGCDCFGEVDRVEYSAAWQQGEIQADAKLNLMRPKVTRSW